MELSSHDVNEIVLATQYKLQVMHHILNYKLGASLQELLRESATRTESGELVIDESAVIVSRETGLQQLVDLVFYECVEGDAVFTGKHRWRGLVGLLSDLIDQSGHFPPGDLVRAHRQEPPHCRNSIEATEEAFCRFAGRMQQMSARSDRLTVRDVLTAAGRQFAEFGGRVPDDLIKAFGSVLPGFEVEVGCIVDELQERLHVESALLRNVFAMAQPPAATKNPH